MSPSTTLRFEGEYAAIPERMREGLVDWVEIGRQPGGFLWAVIRNDLAGAVGAADPENLPLIPLYVRWFHWECPAGCAGSPSNAAAWKAHAGRSQLVKSE